MGVRTENRNSERSEEMTVRAQQDVTDCGQKGGHRVRGSCQQWSPQGFPNIMQCKCKYRRRMRLG